MLQLNADVLFLVPVIEATLLHNYSVVYHAC